MMKLGFIVVCNGLFYLGALGMLEHGVRWGIYGGLYMVIALILLMGRRVIPFFIERASHGDAKLRNAKWLDISSMVLFVLLAINEVFFEYPAPTAWLALVLLILNAKRLIGWHHRVIWQESLLWSIYLAFWMITLGFALLALPYFLPEYFAHVSQFLAIHAFTVGGIGMITLGMMSRVALAHTGHNVYQPPRAIAYALVAIGLSAAVRVLLPLINGWVDVVAYERIIAISQGLWVLAFIIFVIAYAPLLCRPVRS